MPTLQELEKRLVFIEKRNKRVEADKAWETSLFRVLTITGLTYILIVFLMYMARISNPFVNAIVPATGYFLSMRSLSLVKKWWIKRRS